MALMKKVIDTVSRFAGDAIRTMQREAVPGSDEKIALLERQVQASQRTLAAALADTRRIELDIDETREQCDRWHAKACTSLSAGDEETARTAVGRECELRKRVKTLGETRTAHAERTEALMRDFEASKAQLETLKRELNTASARKDNAVVKQQLARATRPDAPDSVVYDIRQMTEETMRREAEAEAILSIHSGLQSDPALEKEFAAMEYTREVDSALEKLRSELDITKMAPRAD